MQSFIIKVRKEYPEYSITFGERVFQNNGVWYAVSGNPWNYPRSVFDIQVRNVKKGDLCPDCKEAKLAEYVLGAYDWLTCDWCGALDEDSWWGELKFRIHWRGKSSK